MNTSYDEPQLDSVLQALANQKRRAIIHDLSLNPNTVGELARRYDLSLPAIHKHIRTLENAKLILRKKSGRTNFVALNIQTLNLAKNWIDQYNTQWGSVEATLENYISGLRE
ncbi:MAG: transcriptional regulator [Candidatus Saccharibacteria bacterium]|nr:transcriptional regulator [Candidatus Saccharibacteria bacterium]